MKCPPFNKVVIVSDDQYLAAELSSIFAQKGKYLPIVEGPRAVVPDPLEEVIRRSNAIARSGCTRIVFAGFECEKVSAFTEQMPKRLKVRTTIESVNHVDEISSSIKNDIEPLHWGRDRIGIGLLNAMRNGKRISFGDHQSPREDLPSKNNHIVVCEEGEPLSEVIAANYAFALGAGLYMIPNVSREESDDILEGFYSAYDADIGFSERMASLKARLRDALKHIEVPVNGSVTFVSGGLPYGFALAENPSTHLFKFPDLGISVINGFAAEQPKAPPKSFVALVDPGSTPAGEITAAQQLLANRGGFVRAYEDGAADVRSITHLIEWFPYDLLIIATHCGDASGWRFTYEFKDSDGQDRVFVVDIAIGVGRPADGDDKLKVTEFMRFISLDGVAWDDPEKAEKLVVGSAVHDLMRLTKKYELKPVRRETVDRVVGSSMLKMSDDNMLILPKPIADHGTPIIINNACSSWHRLAHNMMYGNARAYVGTLHPVTSGEAETVITRLLERHIGKLLPHALWSAQREAYRDNPDRRPYVIAGVYPQRLQFSGKGFLSRMIHRLSGALNNWTNFKSLSDKDDGDRIRLIEEATEFYSRELAYFKKLAADQYK